MDPAAAYPDSPMDADDVIYPCKGCGEILEEGKAFELAGNRWHIDCFRCNTCDTILDSDANLLLLGDGSLICNNCTYSCSVCNNKIEDLAILTGDQAFCANCFKCRSCKKKIENLKYARTSQGIFCMDCHESLMQRRRKKSHKTTTSSRHKHIQQQHQHQNNSIMLDKSLPSLPPNASHRPVAERSAAFSPETNSPISESYQENGDLPSSRQRPSNSRARSDMGTPDLSRPAQRRPDYNRSRSSASDKRERARSPSKEEDLKENVAPSHPPQNSNRHSTQSNGSGEGDDFIPMRLDPNPAPGPSPIASRDPQNTHSPPATDGKPTSKEYFNAKNPSLRTRNIDQEPQSRFAAVDSANGSRNSSQPSSPHIAHQYQERSRQFSSEHSSDLGRKKGHHGATSSLNAVANESGQETTAPRRNGESNTNGRFMLQEAPKSKRSEKRNSKGDGGSQNNNIVLGGLKRKELPSNSNKVKEQQVTVTSSDLSDSSKSDATLSGSPDNAANKSQTTEGHTSSLGSQLRTLPERGDSLARAGQVFQKRHGEAGVGVKNSAAVGGPDTSVEPPNSAISTSSAPPPAINQKSLNRPMDSPSVQEPAHTTAPPPPLRSRERVAIQDEDSSSDSFTTPRAPPQPPSATKGRSEPSHPSHDEPVVSPRLPRYYESEDAHWDEEQARTPGHETSVEAPGFLRRVSHSMRHARSYSDRGVVQGKDSKWSGTKSPMISSPTGNLAISSPIATSPDSRRDDNDRLRRELELERQRVSELETALDARTSIKQMNSELKEKRSTMVVLDTQKEIVVRELETLTDHIAAAKRSGEPFDVTKMTSTVLREFAQQLEALKSSYQPQIEELTQRRNDLSDEVNGLDQRKEKSVQELEQLTAKNAQLSDLNNQLVHQIQELYKANSGPALDGIRPAPNSLGTYSPHTQSHKVSLDIRDQRPSLADSGLTGSTAIQEQETEPGTFVAAPQVVNIRKAQPKKFNWKKGGHNVAKGVTKGLKGAFGGDDKRKEGLSTTEGMPYGSMSQQEYPKTDSHGRGTPQDQRPGFGGFFGKPQARPNQWKNSPNTSFPGIANDGNIALFGSELEQRAEFERTNIPSIVVRCIQEVDARGMDIEGIYRKSGSASQVQVIRDGFERNNDFDISDPDLDINAVTSCLKQYFRKLPTPLITFDVYNKLLETATYHQPQDGDSNHRAPQGAVTYHVPTMRQAINELPPNHKDTLEVLIFHLARVIEHERENLMTSLNTAVVFAPTIMRPESLAREMSDTQAKNAAVQFLIENCQSIFMSGADSDRKD